MIGAPFLTVTCDPGGRIGVPACEPVNAFVGRISRFARSSRLAKLGSQRANTRIAWQSAFGQVSLIEGRPHGECRFRGAGQPDRNSRDGWGEECFPAKAMPALISFGVRGNYRAKVMISGCRGENVHK
jgi:hypothetical protein